MDVPAKVFAAALCSLILFGMGVEVAQAPPSVRVPAGTTLVTFADLAGSAPPGDHPGPGEYLKTVPAGIRTLEDRRVIIQGFMIPTRVENRLVREFLLVRSQASCCFGLPPRVAEVMEVRMAGHPVEPLMDRIVSVQGRLHVQEHWAGPSLGSLYQLDGEQVTSNSGPKLLTPRQSDRGTE